MWIILFFFSALSSIYAMDAPKPQKNVPPESRGIFQYQERCYLDLEVLGASLIIFSKIKDQFGGKGHWIDLKQFLILRDRHRAEFKNDPKGKNFIRDFARSFNFNDTGILDLTERIPKAIIFDLARPEMFLMLVERVIPRLYGALNFVPYSCKFIETHPDDYVRYLFKIGVFLTHEDNLRKLIRANNHEKLLKILKKNKVAVKRGLDGFNLNNPGIIYDTETFASEATLKVLAKFGLHVEPVCFVASAQHPNRRYIRMDSFLGLTDMSSFKNFLPYWLDYRTVDKIVQKVYSNSYKTGKPATIFGLQYGIFKNFALRGLCFDDPAIFQKHGEYIRHCSTMVYEAREEYFLTYQLMNHMHNIQRTSDRKAYIYVRDNFCKIMQTGAFDQDDEAFLYALGRDEKITKMMLLRGYDMDRETLVPLIINHGGPMVFRALNSLHYDFTKIFDLKKVLEKRAGTTIMGAILFKMNFPQLILGRSDNTSHLAGISRDIFIQLLAFLPLMH